MRGRAEHEAGAGRSGRGSAAAIADLEQALLALEADEATEADAARRRHEARACGTSGPGRWPPAAATSPSGRPGSRSGPRSSPAPGRGGAPAGPSGVRARPTRLPDRAHRVAAVAVERLDALVARHRAVIDGRLAELQEQRRRQSDEARAVTAHLEVCAASAATPSAGWRRSRERQPPAEIDGGRGPHPARGRGRDVAPRARRRARARRSPRRAPTLPEGVTPAARARELERELRLLGPINPLALEEFTALQERHTFLEGSSRTCKQHPPGAAAG